MRRPLIRIAAAVAVVAAMGLTGGTLAAEAATAHTASTTVKVTEVEFKFILSTKTVAPGSVTFKITNKGKIAHDFSIAGKKSGLTSPGKSATLTVTLKAGSYPYKCTVPGHAALGMKGTLKVT